MKTLFAWMMPFAVLCGSAASGCNWNNLDEAVKNAPVLSVGPPPGYSASDVGSLVVPLQPREPGVAAEFLVASSTRTSLALVRIDANGTPTTFNVPGAPLTAIQGESFSAAAMVTRPDQDHNSVLLGMADFQDLNTNLFPGQVAMLHIRPGPTFTLDPPVTGPASLPSGVSGPYFGRGIGVGQVSVPSALPDLVVVSDVGVTLFDDGVTTTPINTAMGCPVAVETIAPLRIYQNSRNPVIADLIEDLEGNEIAVGVTRLAGGSVVLLSREGTSLACPMTISMPGVPSFGTTVTAGDLNGDSKMDLVVGAPAGPNPKVMVFFGPFNPATPPVAPSFEIMVPGTETAMFGARVKLADLDGQPGLEIAVAAPRFSAKVEQGGAVFLFNAQGAPLPGTPVVEDNAPSSQAALGEALEAVTFRDAECIPNNSRTLLVAGANEEVFTFFHLQGVSRDPRICSAQ